MKDIELLDWAWSIIANAGGCGDWQKESPEWRQAAEKWRDAYHERLKKDSSPREGGSK